VGAAMVKWFVIGFAAGALIYGGIWLTHSILIALFGSGAGLGSLEAARQYGIKCYNVLKEELRGTAYVAHHIIEKRFSEIVGIGKGDMASVALTSQEHQIFTNLWRNQIPYLTGTATATKEIIWKAAQIVYAEYPALLKVAEAELGI